MPYRLQHMVNVIIEKQHDAHIFSSKLHIHSC